MADVTWLEKALKSAQIAAIVVGGAWVYLKTISGRTFIPRLQLKVSGKVLQNTGVQYLMVDMQVQNVGTFMARIREKGSGLEIGALQKFGLQEIMGLNPKHRTALSVFDLDKHKKPTMVIEPGAIIYSQEIIEVPMDRYDAFRVELRVSAFRGAFSRKDRKWSAWAIALPETDTEIAEREKGVEQ